jgi:hypothetical protein
MSQQHRKKLKRIRRKRYVERVKERIKSLKRKSK